MKIIRLLAYSRLLTYSPINLFAWKSVSAGRQWIEQLLLFINMLNLETGFLWQYSSLVLSINFALLSNKYRQYTKKS